MASVNNCRVDQNAYVIQELNTKISNSYGFVMDYCLILFSYENRALHNKNSNRK